jgi:EAL domain-containing protein (putative c-di-GMP-specific phosphodiesterase class I)
VDGQRFEVGASIGVAVAPAHGADAAALLQHADVAMYVAKRGRSGYALYDADQDGHSLRRLALMGELRQTIAAGQLTLHYQPKVTLATGQLQGVEALVRWPHPERGLIPPAEFIPLAEQTGVIGLLTQWVLDTALRQARAWRDQGLACPVAVNLSARLLHDPSVVDTIVGLLDAWGLDADGLEIEITESAVMADPAGALAILTRLHDRGIRLSIDDFGTGYSSLAYLQRLPIDMIKIDQSFVRELATNGDDAAIARAIVDLGHTLGMGVVAEGVEDDATRARLTALGCDVAQGYYIGRPVPADQLARWVQVAGSGDRPPDLRATASSPSCAM